MQDSSDPAEEADDSPDGPSKVMHEDDPVLFRRYPTRLNRQNIKRLGILGAIVTFILFAYTGYLLVNDQKKFEQVRIERNHEIAELACALAAPFPDEAASGLVFKIRHKYHCPPFDPLLYPLRPTQSR